MDGHLVIEKVDGKLINEIEKGDWLGQEPTPTELLLLKQIRFLTNDEIFEICKIAAPNEFGDYRFSKWEIKPDPKNSKTWQAVDIKNEKSRYSFIFDLFDGDLMLYDEVDGPSREVINENYRQWFFRNGYALPLWPWGKTAIELGIAIDINKLKNISKPDSQF